MQSFEHSKGSIYFTLGGIPTAIRPSSWIVLFLFGSIIYGRTQSLAPILIFVVGGMICLLAHEYAHAFTCRLLGGSNPAVEIAAGGGSTCSTTLPRSTAGQVIMTLAGPMSSFLLSACCGIILGLQISSPSTGLAFTMLMPLPYTELDQQYVEILGRAILDGELSQFALTCYGIISSIGIWWGIFNLLPVFPLDGGQTVYLLTRSARVTGTVGIVVSALVCLWCIQNRQIYLGALCAYYAYINWAFLKSDRDDY